MSDVEHYNYRFEFIRIANLTDRRLEDYRDIRDRDLLGESGRPGLFIGEQMLTVEKMLSLPRMTKSVLITEKWLSRISTINLPQNSIHSQATIPVYIIPQDMMTSVVGFPIHRGALAVGRRSAVAERAIAEIVPAVNRACTLLLCESISNIDNIGLLFRNAAAFGVDGVILSPDCHDPLYRKSIRVSIGHVLTTPWARSTDWQRDLDQLKDQHQITLIGSAIGKSAIDIDQIKRPRRAGVIVGSEFDGLCEATLERCNHIGRIPMMPGIDSLNVGVAAAVCLHRFATSQRV